jgi:hypothetical protein
MLHYLPLGDGGFGGIHKPRAQTHTSRRSPSMIEQVLWNRKNRND